MSAGTEVPIHEPVAPDGLCDVRAIAFYLPQFHPIPENDAWWGKGFTEWRNVTKAQPLFPGHYQPHLPADLGFYDLRIPEVREAQAQMAREYGIHGFCYYHYWFNGRQVLERPLTEVLTSGRPEFPFCLCWANENWTRAWDGGSDQTLLEQRYSTEDDLAHINHLIPIFRDPRYIKVNGRPLFLVYRTGLLPDAARTAQTWRAAARNAGVGDPYLVRVERFSRDVIPESIGFDATVEFAPDHESMQPAKNREGLTGRLSRLGILPRAFTENRVVDYADVARNMSSRAPAEFKRFRCVTPMWDNSARRKRHAWILTDSEPRLYEAWLRAMVEQTRHLFSGDERLIFINAWNEWAEGNHLEPDLRWGHAYLEATRTALYLPHPRPEPSRGASASEAASGFTNQAVGNP